MAHHENVFGADSPNHFGRKGHLGLRVPGSSNEFYVDGVCRIDLNHGSNIAAF